jgi:hypothetical protein
MESLFSRCNRYPQLTENRAEPFQYGPLQEINLDVSTEEFLSAEKAFTYADLHDLVGNLKTIAWLTPHASVTRAEEMMEDFVEFIDGACWYSFTADGKHIYAVARSLSAGDC